MALTAAEKKWLRKMVREVLTEVITNLPEDGMMTSYDGATPFQEDDWSEEGKKGKPKRRRIGFR